MIGKLILPIALQIIGVIIIFAEFLLPSGGILTIAACGVFSYSLYAVFSTLPKEVGFIFICVDAIMIPVSVFVGIKILANSPLALKKTLSSSEGVTSQDTELQTLVGKTGTVISDLRPAGRAEIDNKRLDVVSEGDYIKKGSKIVVVSCSGNRIVVQNKD